MTWPDPGTWEIDPRHTSIIFTAQHLVVARVRGRFDVLSGSIEVRDPVEESRLSVTVEAGSVNSGVAKRDGHLRSPDFLDVERFPTLSYVSTGLRLLDERTFTVEGDLTLHGVTRPVELAAEYLGSHADGDAPLVAFVATTSIDRNDFDLSYNRPLPAGGFAVGPRIDIEITVEALPAGIKRVVA
ncbi:YceI family protein [Sinosporangium siamense]|uniref:Lipid/polyisoprenoid-binding YceI-like domain-containing protein n=1 Tax=Sinosporangium siamense TaxID=1367973 RepID=A0A919RB92_9ACTN|nr:YceI family protein [Sinosporangium siamense]GII90503.1 hypothetical protein Ssi02_07340 [Sinosporangium siamense]